MGAYAIRASYFGWSGVGAGIEASPAGNANVTITYPKALRNSPQPASAQFTATVAGTGRAVSGVAVGGTGNKVLTITLASAPTVGQTVVIAYVPGAVAANRLAYADGGEIAAGSTSVVAA